MKRPVAALCLVLVTLSLADCGRIRDSRLNPFNWFGRAQATATTTTLAPNEAADGRQLIREVTDLTLEKMPTGVIVRATGLPPTQGYWEAELVPQPLDESGRLVLDFRVFPPIEAMRAGTPPSREVVVALYLSNYKLDSIREIVVQGETNARAARR